MKTDQTSAEPQGRQLRRELRLTDLVFMQVPLVTTETCIGIAARQSPTHVALWIIGILLFFVPLAVVIRYLGQALPWEGGVYQWVRIGFAGWNFWIYSIFLTSSRGISIAESLSYPADPQPHG